MDDYSLDNPYPTGQGGANVPGFNTVTLGRAQLLKLGMTKTFGANTINEFHFSYMRAANNCRAAAGRGGPEPGFARIRGGAGAGNRSAGSAD